MTSYHETATEPGAKVETYEQLAQTQEEKIAALFHVEPGKAWAPSALRDKLFSKLVPVTSVRRALSNLTRDGVLAKTDDTVDGPHGHAEHLWRLASAPSAPSAGTFEAKKEAESSTNLADAEQRLSTGTWEKQPTNRESPEWGLAPKPYRWTINGRRDKDGKWWFTLWDGPKLVESGYESDPLKVRAEEGQA